MQTIPSLVNMMQTLIGTMSISSVSPKYDHSNRQVIDQLATWFSALGFTVDIQPVAEGSDKANLIATLGQGANGLVLAGHTDTVPCNADLWQSDPFTLTERDNRWYGLGTADMKGFFALVLEAVRELDAGQLKQPLIVIATADEESSMSGGRALLNGPVPAARQAIVGEPTGLRPIRAHKGIFMEEIRIQGRSGHSSNPALGHNAIEAMYKVLAALMLLREELAAQYQAPAFDVPHPTLNFGHVCGGDNPNRICGDCVLHIDFRLVPGMAMDDVRERIQQRVRQSVADTGTSVSFKPLFGGVDALETPENSELVRLAEQLTAQPAGAVAFATEAPFFQQMGVEPIVLGPGFIEQAHQPDEYIPLDHIQPAIQCIQAFIKHYCL